MKKPKSTKAEKELLLFNRRIAQSHSNMRGRFGHIPFSIATLRKRMLPWLGQKCYFCNEALRAKTFSIDHVIPIARGGKRNLGNLQMLCNVCNRSKADLTNEEYHLFICFLQEEMGPEAQRSILRRLRAAPSWIR